MKLKNLLYATVGSAVLAFSTASCSDYLDISGEFNASLGVDQVWDNATYTRNWYGVIYRNLMEYSETGSEVNAFKNPWSNLCGEIASEKASSRDVMMAGFTAASLLVLLGSPTPWSWARSMKIIAWRMSL